MQGFSLVELSIVLVILGLLTGGILSGQSLIRASELRSVTTQVANTHAAIMTFRDKYMALPGDMNNATKFWGTDPDGCPTHSNWQTGKTATCDGNGSGGLDTKPEQFRFWQHLAAAGLIEGNYSGVTGPTNSGSCTSIDYVLGVNAPSLRMNQVGMGAQTLTSYTPGQIVYMFAGNYGNVFNIGKQITGCNPVGGVFKPEEAWNIDTKLDDGKPGMGALLTRVSCSGDGCLPNCNTATTSAGSAASNAEYLLGGTTAACSFYYKF